MKKTISRIKTTITSTLIVFSSAILCANASAKGYQGAVISTDSNGKEGIEQVLKMTVDIMTAGIAVLAVIGIVVSGVQYLTASGNEEQLKKSKRRIFEIVIGLAAYVLIYALLRWLLPTFGQ